jgi:hypothetical protein
VGIAFSLASPAAPVVRSSTEAGSTYRGPITGADWGRPVETGDLDNDGYDDLIVAACESWGGTTSRVYVIRGGPGAHGRGFVDLATTPASQVIVGAQVDDNLGASIATGDVNGDGIDDLLLCASTADFNSLADCGVAYLIYGSPSFFASSTRDLAVNSNWNVRIAGPVAAGDMGGSNSFGGLDAQGAAIGRLNSDAFGDIALGVHLANGSATQSGRAYIISGAAFPSGTTIYLSSALSYACRINGRAQYDELGTMIDTGDLTGDGIEELILGVEWASRGLFTSDGVVYILRGRASWPNSWSLISTPADITLRGARESDYLGSALVAADFTGDGIVDLAAAAPGAELGALNDQIGDGIIYGLRGATSYQTGTYNIDYLTTLPDFRLIGDPQEGLGALVTAADVNDDGIADIIAGEWFGGPSTNGVVEVLYGRAFAQGASFTASISTDLRIVGQPNDRISFSLGAGDTNGDDLDEIVFGTPFNGGDRGTVYVFTHVTGDSDHDGDVDLHDVAGFQACFSGGPTGGLSGGCVQFDFTLNEGVEAADWAAFEARLTAPVGP